MADILVDLDDITIHALLRRAERAGRSLSDEMLSILKTAAGEREAGSFDEAVRFADEMRRKSAGKISGDSVDLIREDRDR